MGFSGRLAYSDGRWSTGRPTAVPFLLVDVHDSSIATVDYRAANASGGEIRRNRIWFNQSYDEGGGIMVA